MLKREYLEARRIIAHAFALDDFAKAVTLVSLAVSLTPLAFGFGILAGGF